MAYLPTWMPPWGHMSFAPMAASSQDSSETPVTWTSPLSIQIVSDYRALRDIDDAREITVFENILKIIGHPGLKSCKWNIKPISKMRGKSPPSWKYIKEMHTIVIGKKHQGQFTEPFFQGWPTCQLGGNRGDIWALLLWRRAVKVAREFR